MNPFRSLNFIQGYSRPKKELDFYRLQKWKKKRPSKG